jgi:hypothetical protein
MAESDPYEEWKAQGRPGGSFANYVAQQQQATPQVTEQPAQRPTPQPTPTTPAPPGGASPFADPTATQEYNRMVAAGESPDTAANIVRNALFGVQHDWSEQGGDKGQLWAGGGPLGQGAEYAVNQYRAWEKDRMPGCPPDFPYRGRNGQCAEKPDDCPDGTHVEGTPGKCVPNGPGQENLPKGPNDTRSGQGWTPPPPPQPVTSGGQLSMTGNAMQDMLISQFNNGVDPNTGQANIFGLGADMRVGGTGVNADGRTASDTKQAQSLSGGGLWWGENKDAFSGFDASKKNADGTETPSPAAPKATEPAATPAPVVNPAQPNGPARMGGMYTAPKRPKPTTIAGMAQNQFANPARNKPSYF